VASPPAWPATQSSSLEARTRSPRLSRAPGTRPCIPLAPKTTGTDVAADAGPPAPCTGFDGETRDPAWASQQEEQLDADLTDLLRHHDVDFAVECRSRCCELTSKEPVSSSVRSELRTSAGLTGWTDSLGFSDTIIPCFDRKAGKKPLTDLVRERNRIVDETSFEECARLTTVPMDVTILAAVDAKGGVQTGRQGELSGSEAARCVERRIVEVARFGTQPEPRTVQFLVRLDPDGGR
jgi:hypothetical protein